ncbi:MAG: hypothetical protein WBW88_17095 [Rhodothermales bacterium]
MSTKTGRAPRSGAAIYRHVRSFIRHCRSGHGLDAIGVLLENLELIEVLFYPLFGSRTGIENPPGL